MNYYLARDGQTYGPYPQESFPAMMQQGQVVPTDLVCPEGGADWVQVSQVPGLAGATPAPAAVARMGPAAPVVASSSKSGPGGLAMPAVAASSSAPAAMPTAVASSKLRISTTPASHAPAAAAMPASGQAHSNYPKAAYPQQKAGLMEKAAGAWGVLRILGYVAVAIVIVVGVVIGYMKSQSDKKEIAKLHVLPGWQAFNAGNSQIDSEASTAGFGNTGVTQRFAEEIAERIEQIQKSNFPPPKPTRYRGRSKLGRITSAVNSTTAGLGKPQVYAERRGTVIITLVHVPDFSRYGSSTRGELSEVCWDTTHDFLATRMATMLKLREQLTAKAPAAYGLTNRLVPPRSGRPPSVRAPQPAVAAAAPSPSPSELPPELTLVVGVRGSDDYECVYVGKVTGKGGKSTPTLTKKNVPSHQELVKWFGEEKSQTE